MSIRLKIVLIVVPLIIATLALTGVSSYFSASNRDNPDREGLSRLQVRGAPDAGAEPVGLLVDNNLTGEAGNGHRNAGGGGRLRAQHREQRHRADRRRRAGRQRGDEHAPTSPSGRERRSGSRSSQREDHRPRHPSPRGQGPRGKGVLVRPLRVVRRRERRARGVLQPGEPDRAADPRSSSPASILVGVLLVLISPRTSHGRSAGWSPR